jgi:hypothetical protein
MSSREVLSDVGNYGRPHRRCADRAAQGFPPRGAAGIGGNCRIATLKGMLNKVADVKQKHARPALGPNGVKAWAAHRRRTHWSRTQDCVHKSTIAEQGYPGLPACGLPVPAGTPAEIVARLNEAGNAALKSPAIVAHVQAEGGVVLGGSSAAFTDKL